jgi:hypothetical protein
MPLPFFYFGSIMDFTNDMLADIAFKAKKEAEMLAATLRSLTKSWKDNGLLMDFSFNINTEKCKLAKESFSCACTDISARLNSISTIAEQAAKLEESPMMNANQTLHFKCVRFITTAITSVSSAAEALGLIDENSGTEPKKAAHFINELTVAAEEFAKLNNSI